jgi:hypothetical protein
VPRVMWRLPVPREEARTRARTGGSGQRAPSSSQWTDGFLPWTRPLDLKIAPLFAPRWCCRRCCDWPP